MGGVGDKCVELKRYKTCKHESFLGFVLFTKMGNEKEKRVSMPR